MDKIRVIRKVNPKLISEVNGSFLKVVRTEKSMIVPESKYDLLDGFFLSSFNNVNPANRQRIINIGKEIPIVFSQNNKSQMIPSIKAVDKRYFLIILPLSLRDRLHCREFIYRNLSKIK
jgi:hypothetical protein